MESQPSTSASGRAAATARAFALGQLGDDLLGGQTRVGGLVHSADHDLGIDARVLQQPQAGRRRGSQDKWDLVASRHASKSNNARKSIQTPGNSTDVPPPTSSLHGPANPSLVS